MIASIGLLLAFQFIWLRKVYSEKKNAFHKEASFAFHHTIMDLQDSLISEKLHASSDTGTFKVRVLQSNNMMRRIKSDLAVTREKNDILDTFVHEDIAVRSPLRARYFSDSTHQIDLMVRNRSGEKNFGGNVQQMILEISGEDTLTDFHMSWIGSGDSLNLDEIENRYAIAMKEIADVEFKIEKLSIQDHLPERRGLYSSVATADFPPLSKYVAYFPNPELVLLNRMLPDFLFSAILLLITCLAFFFIYRSLLRQQRLTQLKTDLIRNITHELKTPITTVGVAIEAMENFRALEDPKKTNEYLEISKNELNRLSMLVDKVLKTSLLDSKEPDLKLEVLDLKDLIIKILQSFKLQFEKNSASVQFHAPGDDFEITADRTHLTSVMYNLIDNAIKYGSKEPRISIDLEKTNSHIGISVRDNGVGIPSEFQDRIFDKFFRVPNGDVHNIKGHGLGLSYVASVIRKHGGRIDVESSPGKGSMFRINLPKSA